MPLQEEWVLKRQTVRFAAISSSKARWLCRSWHRGWRAERRRVAEVSQGRSLYLSG